MKIELSIVAVLALGASGCAGSKSSPTPSAASSTQRPAWVDAKITQFQNAVVGNPPQSIWQYDYQGSVVYYIPAQNVGNSDQYSELYNVAGDLICAPSGGITGRGDGNCTDFATLRTNEVLIWKDTRTASAVQAVAPISGR